MVVNQAALNNLLSEADAKIALARSAQFESAAREKQADSDIAMRELAEDLSKNEETIKTISTIASVIIGGVAIAGAIAATIVTGGIAGAAIGAGILAAGGAQIWGMNEGSAALSEADLQKREKALEKVVIAYEQDAEIFAKSKEDLKEYFGDIGIDDAALRESLANNKEEVAKLADEIATTNRLIATYNT